MNIPYLLIFVLSGFSLFITVLMSLMFYIVGINNVRKFFTSLISVFGIISIFSGYHFLTGQLNSLPDITFCEQYNLNMSYNTLYKNFSNKNYYVHILNDNNDISQIDQFDMIAGIKIIKADSKNTLVKLKIIDFDNNHYVLKNKIAIMRSNDIKPYLHNIYRTNALLEGYIGNKSWSIHEQKTSNNLTTIDKDNDISNIKKLLDLEKH
jgi:hypothetical protein